MDYIMDVYKHLHKNPVPWPVGEKLTDMFVDVYDDADDKEAYRIERTLVFEKTVVRISDGVWKAGALRQVETKVEHPENIDKWPSGVTKHKWDCFMCGAKGAMSSTNEFRGYPAGVCACSACGNRGLACPDVAFASGSLKVDGPSLGERS